MAVDNSYPAIKWLLDNKLADLPAGAGILVGVPDAASESGYSFSSVSSEYFMKKTATTTTPTPTPVPVTTGGVTVISGPLPNFAPFNIGGTTVSGGGSNSLLLSAPPEQAGVTLHGATIPLPATIGSHTFLVRTTYPELGYFSASLFLASASNPHLTVVLSIYPNANGTYTALQDWPDNTSSNLVALSSNPGSFAKAGQEYFLRVSWDGSNYSFAGSQSGQASGWSVIGTATKAALHDPDKIGVYVFPSDATGSGAVTKMELLGYAFSSSADVQQIHGVVSVTSSVPPAPIKYIQQKQTPSSPPITRSVQSSAIQITDPTKNVTYLKFSSTDPNATVPNRAVLDTQCFYTNLFGDRNNPSSFPQAGIPSNFYSAYAAYPAGDPRDLMPIMADGIHLKARSRVPTSSGDFLIECAQLRMQTEYLSGDTVEMRAKLPSGEREPDSYWSWPTFWGFTGFEDRITGVRYYGDNNTCVEYDMPDSYQRAGARQGTTITQGVILYGDPAAYNYGGTLFRADGPEYLPSEQPSNSLKIFGNPDTDPTEGFHTYTHHISTDNTKVYFWIDGKLTWIVSLRNPAINRQLGTDGTTVCIEGGTPDAARLGKPLGQFIQISHQYGVRFNGDDIVKLEALLKVRDVKADDYIIEYFAHWRSAPLAANLVPSATTPLTTPILNGETYIWRGKADAQAYAGTNGKPLIIQGPASPGAVTHSLTKPLGPSPGSWVVEVAGIFPSSDYYRGSALLVNQQTGAHFMFYNLYPQGGGSYCFMATASDEFGSNYVAQTTPRTFPETVANRKHFVKFLINNGVITVYVSATGGLNTWTTVGAMAFVDAGSPTHVGFYCCPADNQQVGLPGQARLYSITSSSSIIPQAAV